MKVKLDKYGIMPTRAHKTDAGLDLYAPCDFIVPSSYGRSLFEGSAAYDVYIGSKTIDTGVHVELPPETVGMVKSKSGLNVKHGLTAEGVIDEGYTGSIAVKLYNHTDKPYKFNKGDKIAQLVVLPIVKPKLIQVDELEETERGDGGFGSTGR